MLRDKKSYTPLEKVAIGVKHGVDKVAMKLADSIIGKYTPPKVVEPTPRSTSTYSRFAGYRDITDTYKAERPNMNLPKGTRVVEKKATSTPSLSKKDMETFLDPEKSAGYIDRTGNVPVYVRRTKTGYQSTMIPVYPVMEKPSETFKKQLPQELKGVGDLYSKIIDRNYSDSARKKAEDDTVRMIERAYREGTK